MNDQIIFSNEELDYEKKIRNLYAAGKIEDALKLAIEFAENYPHSLLAKYLKSAMHGDSADPSKHSPQEITDLKSMAKKGFEEIIQHKDFSRLPQTRQYSIKNEYYWFFEMPLKQFELGKEYFEAGNKRASYSSCVGATMLALKELRSGNKTESKKWANESVKYFKIFEEHDPNWANINYFHAQALAMLEQHKEAIQSYQEMYKKQGAEVNATELAEFQKVLNEIKLLLES